MFISPIEQSHPYARGARADRTWSARFNLEEPLPLEDIVVRQLGGLVVGFADPQWPISGAVLATDNVKSRSVVFGLDPSRKFGTPSVKQCEAIADRVVQTLGWQRQPEDLPEMRVIMGRRVGYDEAEHIYNMAAVRDLTVACGCGSLALAEADLFSLRYVGGLREYHEPGVIVEGVAAHLNALLQVAADMGQERLVAEITGIETQVYERKTGPSLC